MNPQHDDLLQGLARRGCRVETADAGALVSLPDNPDYPEPGDEFIFEQMGEWLYIGTTLMTPEEFEHSAHVASLDRFLLILQHRNLGCHFSYDAAGYLTIGTVLFPEQQRVDSVMQTMEHIGFVIDVCLPFLDHALESGDIAADDEVDQAFGINDRLH